MNKTKRTFLLLLAAIMAASAFTACGGEEKNTESTSSAIQEDNSAQTAEITNEETTEQPAESETEAATEAVTEAATEEDLYGYYELLNAEYERTKDTISFCTGMRDGKVFFINDSTYYIYDIGSGEPALRHSSYYDENKYTNWAYYDGVVYASSHKTSSIYRMNLEGEIITERKLDVSLGFSYELHVMENGYIIISHEGGCLRIAPDFSDVIELPEILFEAAHGFTETEGIKSIIGSNGDMLYVLADNNRICQIDTVSLTASPLGGDAEKESANDDRSLQIVGKYLLTLEEVYDLETYEMIANPLQFGGTYFGGTFNYVRMSTTDGAGLMKVQKAISLQDELFPGLRVRTLKIMQSFTEPTPSPTHWNLP